MLIAFQAEKTDSVPTGLPRWRSNKEALANIGDTRDVGSLPGSGRSLGVGNGNPLQYSCSGVIRCNRVHTDFSTEVCVYVCVCVCVLIAKNQS